MTSTDPVSLQRSYYAATANRYDAMHGDDDGDHGFALGYMLAMVERLGVQSVLDVGSGTGRVPLKVKERLPQVRVVGIEPSRELRAVGQSKGLSPDELVDGDAMRLAYEDGTFDLVCEFGALHHIPDPHRAVAEMLRVARVGVFISDGNNFGQGSPLARLVKQAINALGLWPLADRIKTRGKGYSVSDSDGIAYSYSVFSDYPQIARACRSVHMLNTSNSGPNLYRTAPHVALLGLKKTLR